MKNAPTTTTTTTTDRPVKSLKVRTNIKAGSVGEGCAVSG